eukprot:TRINITY_DN4030_c0_g1_i1.p1 TRINITY_DN4030_c0_g1~~TRINITY_DN4030_c0_g1_i1.p1  ORF type:complete len:350 (+),score=174.45 TRINITY_DN4030_c0_g1_i1:110-1159(+)
MSADLKKGDHVNWESAQGTIEGTVVRKATSDTQIKSHHVNASAEDPQYIVKSDATGSIAAHKPEAIHKDGESASQKGKSSPKSSPKGSKKKTEDKEDKQEKKATESKSAESKSTEAKSTDASSSDGISARTRSHGEQKEEPKAKKAKKEDNKETEKKGTKAKKTQEKETKETKEKESKGDKENEEEEDQSKKRKENPKKEASPAKKSKSTENEEKKVQKDEEKVEKETPKESEASDEEDGDKDQIVKDFNNLVNMSAEEITKWLKTKDSNDTGMTREGETEAVGHQSGRKIVEMLGKKPEDWTDAELQHARKVRSYIKRHSAQRPDKDDLAHTKWTYSLKNWGHDPMKK